MNHRLGSVALSAALALAPCLAAPARAAEQFSIEANAEDGAVSIRIKALVHAHYPVIWGTLTDYDQLAQFVPGMKSSRTIERRGAVAVVEQKGVAEVLIFTYPIEVTVESTESPPDNISVRVIKGNLKRLDGGYRLERVPGSETGYMLSWRGVIEPAFSLPSLLTVPLMRSTLERHFQAMLREIERREALAHPPPPTLIAPQGMPAAPAVVLPPGPPALTPGT
jgi:ribosome-associated toxin RatA of RatAB toxin-antitoxin module